MKFKLATKNLLCNSFFVLQTILIIIKHIESSITVSFNVFVLI